MALSQHNFHRLVIAIAILVYLWAAYNGHGYLQEDEHYQIIEFAQLKSGFNTTQDMAWEYHAGMRSALQPFIAYNVFKCCHWINITDPYLLAFILRLLSAALAIFIIRKFVHATLQSIDVKYQRLYIFSSYLLWFLPLINIRFSSEAWGGLFFLWAVATVLKNNNKLFFIGILLGISFLCRFQTGILSVSLIIWLLLVKKENLIHILKIGGGGLLILAVGIILDYWLYGKLTLCAWNYFYNTTLSANSIQFGNSPWYAYIKPIIIKPFFVFGAAIILSLVVLLLKDRKNIFLWVTIPFIVIHSIIPHKEFRFLYSLINFIPVIIFCTWQIISVKINSINNISLPSILTKIAVWILLSVNMIALAAVMFRAADGRVALSKYLHTRYPSQPTRIIYTKWSDYFTPELPAKFYLEKNTELIQLDSLSMLTASYIDTTKLNFFILRRGVDQIENHRLNNLVSSLGYKKIKQSLPQWIADIGIPTKTIYETEILELYQKQ